MTDTTTDTKVNGRTPTEWAELAAEYEAQAGKRYDAVQESWERSDTDGFLSQWASGITAREFQAKADLARDHGFAEVRALVSVEDPTKVVAWRTGDGQYGTYWIAEDWWVNAGGKRFLNTSTARKDATRRTNNRKKGFTLGLIKTEGWVTTRGVSAISVGIVTLADRTAMREGRYEVIEPELSWEDND